MSYKKSCLSKSKKPPINFLSSLTCHLISSSKSELGKVSKVKLEKFNQALFKNLDVNQRKNSSSVIKWFKVIDNKKNCNFIKFDTQEFYLSIWKAYLRRAFHLQKSTIIYPMKIL